MTDGATVISGELHELLQRAERLAGLGSWQFDISRKRIIWSAQMFRLLGMDPDTFHGERRDFMSRIHPDDLDRARAHFGTIAPYDSEIRIVRDDTGDVRHVQVRGEVIRDRDGSPAVVAGTMLDVTDRVEAQKALELNEKRLRLIIDGIPAFIAHINKDLRYTFANSWYKRWFSGSADITNRSVFDVLGEDLTDEMKADIELVLGGQIVERVRHYPIESGARYARLSLIPDAAQDGRVVGYYVFGMDITELQKVADRLADSNRKLESFAYVASHDLQEPLRIVQGFCELLASRYRGRLDAEADEFIAFAVDGAQRMRALVNDLLEYSRLQQGEIFYAPIDLSAVIDGAIANMRAAIERSGAQITVGELPTISGGHSQLVRLFANLIGNATKFTGEATPLIEISAARRGDAWEVSVADNGIGIAPEYRERIFEIFQRLHGHDEYPGTGMGLAICRHIAQQHRGDIRVESAPGVGSTFVVTLAGASQEEEPVDDRQSSPRSQ